MDDDDLLFLIKEELDRTLPDFDQLEASIRDYVLTASPEVTKLMYDQAVKALGDEELPLRAFLDPLLEMGAIYMLSLVRRKIDLSLEDPEQQ
jgi:hypothetical protein